jgi:hypothetical protein
MADIGHLPSMERPALMAAIAKRGESVLRFAYVVNEMKELRPEPESSFLGTEPQQQLQGFLRYLILFLPVFWLFICMKVGMKTMAGIISPALLIFILWYWISSSDVSRPFEDDAKTAIKRAISNHDLPPRDLPSAQTFTEAFYRSSLKLKTLVPPSSQSSGCDLLKNPGTDSPTFGVRV